jgi:Acyltransferase family
MRPAPSTGPARLSTALSPDFGDRPALYIVARPRQVKAAGQVFARNFAGRKANIDRRNAREVAKVNRRTLRTLKKICQNHLYPTLTKFPRRATTTRYRKQGNPNDQKILCRRRRRSRLGHSTPHDCDWPVQYVGFVTYHCFGDVFHKMNATAPQTAPSARRLTSLDAVRGIASFIVILCHCNAILPDAVQTNGAASVIIFFVLSGYVLALPFFHGTQPNYPRYAFRRFCRIYIPFAVAICIAALLCRITDERQSLAGLPGWISEWSWAGPSVLPGHFFMTGQK